MAAKITVSLPPSLLLRLDRLAKKWETTRSGAVAELLRRSEQEEIEKEMEEGYAALSEKSREEAETFLPAQYEVLTRNGH